MPERITALEQRVDKVENALEARLEEIKTLIRVTIGDLKAEQLADIKASVDRVERDLRSEHVRLADDQRRLWDAVRLLEKDREQQRGSKRAISDLTHGASSLAGAGLGSLLTWLLTRHW